MVAVTLAAMVSSCGEPEAQRREREVKELESFAQTILKEVMFDPTAIMLRNLKKGGAEGQKAVCGEVNGKNRFGGYVGYQPFVAVQAAGSDGEVYLDPTVNEADPTPTQRAEAMLYREHYRSLCAAQPSDTGLLDPAKMERRTMAKSASAPSPTPSGTPRTPDAANAMPPGRLVGWWMEDQCDTGDGGEGFSADHTWSAYGVEGRWALSDDQLTVTKTKQLSLESGELEELSPSMKIVRQITNVGPNRMTLKEKGRTSHMLRCGDVGGE